MSKMDNLRAMREAKYADAQKRAAGAPARPAAKAPVAPATPAAARAAQPASVDASADTDELCGHRNMSGRTCTRERGHSAKSHRYS
ncbi:hypothetical protein SAMN05192575_101855 [Nocardioides alpinus]|uniref:Uncharacterized protein n=1 Tax=Nocardioides alpinus TaxID=748909 RepID=A0A1I0WD09_9ACTN|nr:hypothetical protein [Nocardioides alpinus]PKH37805.1 hypothetical protein CXG46_20625 [Nocardioides alpinus]SFA85796.1 hypothetical protein SAMN05192575_101855 [Nocardioides alpinus]